MKNVNINHPSKLFVYSVVLVSLSFVIFTPRLFASQPSGFTAAVNSSQNLVLTETGTAADDHLRLAFEGESIILTHADGYQFVADKSLQVAQTTADVFVIPTASFTGSQIIINGGAGDDTLTIDFSNYSPAFDKQIVFNGETQTTADTLALVGDAAFDEAIFEFFNEHDGTISLSGVPLITYTGLEPITSGVTAADVTLNYGDSAETITVTDSGGGQTTVDSNIGGEIITFNNPTNSLNINAGGGNDTIVVQSLAAFYPAAISINGQGGADTTNIDGALSTNDRNITFTTEAVNTAATLESGIGSMTFNANIVGLGAALTGTGALTFDPLSNNTTIGIGGGAGTLNLDDAELAFFTDGFSNITVGDSLNGIGLVDIQTAEFRDPITIVGGLVRVNGDLTNVDAADVTLFSRYNFGGATLELDVSAEVSSNGGNITLNAFDDIHVYEPVTTIGNGVIDVNSDLAGTSQGTFQLFSLLSTDSGGITIDAYFGAITGTMLTSGGDIAITIGPNSFQLRDTIIIDTTNNAPAGADVVLDAIVRGRDLGRNITINAGTVGTITSRRPFDSLINNVHLTAREIVLDGSLMVGQNITMTADIVTLNEPLAGGGTLLIEPQTAGTTLSLGDSSGILNLADNELALLQDGFTDIVIGNEAAGDISVSTAAFNDPLTLITAGTISDSADAATDLTAPSVTLDGVVSPRGAAAGTFSINGSTTFAPNSTFEVDLTGSTSTGPHDQLYVAGTVTLPSTTVLSLDLDSYTIHEPAVITIIDETEGLTGTFSGFLEGTQTNPSGDNDFVVSYLNGATLSSAFVLNTAITGSGSGSIRSSITGIDCGLDCVESYLFDTMVTLTATAAVGSTFDGWSGACTGFRCTVTMDQTQTVTATFSQQTFVLNTAIAGDGTGIINSDPAGIHCRNDCTENYPYGTIVTLTVEADDGSIFTGWSGGCSGLDCTVPLTQTQSVTATFELDDYVVYLPLVQTSEPFDPITINPSAIPSTPVVNQGEVFYVATILMPDHFPDANYYLSASPTVLQPIMVDDILTMDIQEGTIFSYDFSTTGEVVPQLVRLDQTIINQIAGQTVIVTFRDEYGRATFASPVYLIMEP